MNFEKTAKNFYALIEGGEYDLATEVKSEYYEATGMFLVPEKDFPDTLIWEVDSEGNYLRFVYY